MNVSRWRWLTVTAVAVALATTGCGRSSGEPAQPAATPAGAVASESPGPAPADASSEVAGAGEGAAPSARPEWGPDADINTWQPAPTESRNSLFWASDPTGSADEIALRFVSALRSRDDWAAARELGLVGRAFLANHDPAVLHLVMADVFANAQLAGTPPCTRSAHVSVGAVAVHCGPRVVVVHVNASAVRSGVLVSLEHARKDAVRGPHTHAYTRFVLL